MLVFEFRTYGEPEQFAAIDDAIRTVQFIRNKCIRFWLDNPKVGKYDKNLVENHCLAKSINDVGWYQFRVWLEYFGKVFKRITIAVNPAYTSQECSSCGVIVKKSLSTRTHACQCGCVLDRDHNAGINILNSGLGTVGHTGTSALDVDNAWGDTPSTLLGENLSGQGMSRSQESPALTNQAACGERV